MQETAYRQRRPRLGTDPAQRPRRGRDDGLVGAVEQLDELVHGRPADPGQHLARLVAAVALGFFQDAQELRHVVGSRLDGDQGVRRGAKATAAVGAVTAAVGAARDAAAKDGGAAATDW